MRANVLFCELSAYLDSPWNQCSQVIRHADSERVRSHVLVDTKADGDLRLGGHDAALVKRLALTSSLNCLLRGSPGAAVPLASSFARALRLVREQRIDIIHCNDDPRSMVFSLLLARRTRTKLLLHVHNSPFAFGAARRQLTRWIALRADHCVGVSRYVAQHIERLGVEPSRIAVVPNAVDPERFHPGVDGSAVREELGIAPDEVVALLLGRIIRVKRHEDFVRALALARRSTPRLRGLIVGWEDPRAGGYRGELERLARRLGLGDSLLFINARPDAPQLHAASDIAVLPSAMEAFGLVVVEAMASGKPFVGARTSAFPEIVEEGKTAFLVELGDAPRLAFRLASLAADPQLRERMGSAGRRVVLKRFTPERLGAEFSILYESLLRGRTASASLTEAANAAPQARSA
jgi:glycosyltransferase involved in cell wall biosynthesis